MDFRAATLPPPSVTMQSLFTPPAPPPPPQNGMFLYPGLSSPVKPPPLHMLPSHKLQRSTATVPPLLQQQTSPASTTPAPPPATVPTTAHASSFSAALKSLARNAGGTDAKDSVGKVLESSSPSPKRLPPPSVPRPPHTDNAPPVVTIAPTPTHQIRDAVVSAGAEATKPSAEVPAHLRLTSTSSSVTQPPSTSAQVTSGTELRSGFQPYRPPHDERAALEALYPGYPHPAGLYPLHPAQHPLYGRLEEQLYLERLGLLRPPLGVAGVPAYSSLMAGGAYPPELLHSSLYMSQSLYLQERWKLEEDARRRLEAERDRARQLSQQGTPAPPPAASRDRSPHRRTPTPAAAGASVAPHSEHSSSNKTGGGHQEEPSPAAYRPYLPSPSPKPAAPSKEPPRAPLDLSRSEPPAPTEPAPSVNGVRPRQHSGKSSRSHKKTTVVRPFEDRPNGVAAEPAGPLNLSDSAKTLSNGVQASQQKRPISYSIQQHIPEPAGKPNTSEHPSRTTAESYLPQRPPGGEVFPAKPPGGEIYPGKPPVNSMYPAKTPISDVYHAKPPAELQSSKPPSDLYSGRLPANSVHSSRHNSGAMDLSAVPQPTGERANGIDLSDPTRSRASASETSRPVASRLDRREQRKRQGHRVDEDPESPELKSIDVLSGPPLKPETSPEKLTFLSSVGLTTHGYKNGADSFSAASSPEMALRPPSRLTSALNRAPDLAAKRIFLERLGLTPAGEVKPKRESPPVRPDLPTVPAAVVAPVPEEKGRKTRGASAASPKSPRQQRAQGRSSPYSRPQAQPAPTPQPPAAAAPQQPEPPPVLSSSLSGWPGVQSIRTMYAAYTKERAAETEQAVRAGERLRAQQQRLEATTVALSLRLNRVVAQRSQLSRQRDEAQEQLERLGVLLQALHARTARRAAR